MNKTRVSWFVPGVVFFWTFCAFLPALHNQFISTWDDKENFLKNPYFRGLDWSHLRWMFTKSVDMGLYIPLSWLTLGLDYHLWGMDPLGYHLTNVLLHAINAVLFCFLVLVLYGRIWQTSEEKERSLLIISAGIAALLFSVHPLRVESVAWITERRDLFSGTLFFLTLLAYLKFSRPDTQGKDRRNWFIATLGLYLLSLLSKAIGMTLPVILTILDIYPLKRLGGAVGWFGKEARKIWFEKIPFTLLALPAAWVAGYSQMRLGAAASIHGRGFLERLALTFYGPAFYVWKTIWPFHLSPIYELPPHHFTLTDPPYLASALFVMIVSVSFFLLRRRWPALLAVWACYGVILLPVSGIFQSGPHQAADRISYLSCLGWAMLAGAGFFLCWRWLDKKGRPEQFLWVGAGMGLILAGLTFLTRQQCRVWHDSKTLWSEAMEWTPDSSVAQNNMGSALSEEGNNNEAIPHFERAIELNPSRSNFYFNLGLAQFEMGRWDEAIRNLQRFVEIEGNNTNAQLNVARAQLNMASAFFELGNADESIRRFKRAIEIRPGLSDSYFNLGLTLHKLGRWNEAIGNFQRFVEIEGSNANAQLNVAWAQLNLAWELFELGKENEAIQRLEGLRLGPYQYLQQVYWGMLLARRDRLEEAARHFRLALELQPHSADAYYNLGGVLMSQGKTNQAIECYQKALQLNPALVPARLGLAAASRKKKNE